MLAIVPDQRDLDALSHAVTTRIDAAGVVALSAASMRVVTAWLSASRSRWSGTIASTDRPARTVWAAAGRCWRSSPTSAIWTRSATP
ncbi:hypothetical protein MAHJHV54_47450 [Mycobacterium avium subsp. hominissuis]